MGDARATKRWVWRPALGEWSKISYAAGARFHAEERQVASLADVVRELEGLRQNPCVFVVRGALAPWVREQLSADPYLRIPRWKLVKVGRGEPSLVETPCQWLMIDVDNFPLLNSEDLLDDPQFPIDRAIRELLPPAFHDVTCWWQLSSSAGFAPGLKCHLFFWLGEPATNDHIRRVLEQHAPGVDRSLFNAAQPHFIADPIIEGGPDPLPRRTGWRIGEEDAVILPDLIPSWRKPRSTRNASATSSTAGTGGSVQDALDRMGDGEGSEGFHVPLRTGAMRYAKQCARYGNRDDDDLKRRMREAVHAAPKGPSRDGWQTYLSDDYLDRLIDGAMTLVATGDPGAPASIKPEASPPTATVDQARDAVGGAVRSFFSRTSTWWGDEETDEPEHAAIVVSTGIGKSVFTRSMLPNFIATQKAADKPHRVLWLVPHHRLSEEAVDDMRNLGLTADIMRGREALTADNSRQTMCLDLKAVEDARVAGADVELAVCGTGQKGKPACRFRHECTYQQQKGAVLAADVVIAAHQHLFHRLPTTMGKGFGLVVVDESWWQAGLNPNRTIPLADFATAVLKHPVLLRDGKKDQRVDHVATQELHRIARKAEAALMATPAGQHASRAALDTANLTANECEAAAQLELMRKRNPKITPGMAADDRKAAAKAASVNATLARRSALWAALAAFLRSSDDLCGHVEVSADEGHRREITLHSLRPIHDGIIAVPMLLLDATLPLPIVHRFLPRLMVLANIAAQAPHQIVQQVTGGWGKTSLIPHPGTGLEENRRREGQLQELRDFVAFHGGGNALVITYRQIEGTFSDLRGVRPAHFNALSGLDAFGDISALFVIGRPLPATSELRALALALTGRVIPDEQPVISIRGALLADGTGTPLSVRAYADPNMEDLRRAITDAELVQAIGRGRGVNRTAANPLTVYVLADVLLPMQLTRVAKWADVRLSPVERMAARGLVLTSPTDAAKFFPGLFPSAEAAKKALQRGISGTFPYEEITHRGMSPKSLLKVEYRPSGRGQQRRKGWVAPWRADTLRDDLGDAVGPFAHYACQSHSGPSRQQEAAMLAPTPAEIEALTDDEKLVLRSQLCGTPTPSPDVLSSAPEGYGELVAPSALFRQLPPGSPNPASSFRMLRSYDGMALRVGDEFIVRSRKQTPTPPSADMGAQTTAPSA